mgnify:CR=1 FL=1|jgi:hypothetical protein
MSERGSNNIDLTQMDDSVPESVKAATIGLEDDGFFDDLEKAVNGMVIDPQTTQPATRPKADPGIEKQSVQAPEESEQTTEDRYAASSREAKNLKQRLTEVEPYLPILDDMRRDPKLIEHVRNYYETGGEPGTQITDQLNLPEDFRLDADEAFTDPKSDSAKVVSATIERVVQERLRKTLAKERETTQRVSAEQDFRQRHKMSDDQWEEYKSFAKEHALSHDDILYLKNREKREAEIARTARDENQAQRTKMESTPRSMANRASAADEDARTEDDKIFDLLSRTGNGADNLINLGE